MNASRTRHLELSALDEAILKNEKLGHSQRVIPNDVYIMPTRKAVRDSLDTLSVKAVMGVRMHHAPNKTSKEYILAIDNINQQNYLDEKRKKIDEIHSYFHRLREENNRIFMGGYTMPAIQSHKVQAGFLDEQEKKELEKVEKEYDNSAKSREEFMERRQRLKLLSGKL